MEEDRAELRVVEPLDESGREADPRSAEPVAERERAHVADDIDAAGKVERGRDVADATRYRHAPREERTDERQRREELAKERGQPERHAERREDEHQDGDDARRVGGAAGREGEAARQEGGEQRDEQRAGPEGQDQLVVGQLARFPGGGQADHAPVQVDAPDGGLDEREAIRIRIALPVAELVDQAAHEILREARAVLVAGERRPVDVRLPVAVAHEEPLRVQPGHDRHHGRVRERSALREVVDHVANGGPAALPEPVHDLGLERSEERVRSVPPGALEAADVVGHDRIIPPSVAPRGAA